jgi:hypothetical protein
MKCYMIMFCILNSKVERLWFMRMLHEIVKENVAYSGMLNSSCVFFMRMLHEMLHEMLHDNVLYVELKS